MHIDDSTAASYAQSAANQTADEVRALRQRTAVELKALKVRVSQLERANESPTPKDDNEFKAGFITPPMLDTHNNMSRNLVFSIDDGPVLNGWAFFGPGGLYWRHHGSETAVLVRQTEGERVQWVLADKS